MVEANLRRSLLISLGDPWVFFTRPISALLLALAVLTFAWPILRRIREERLSVAGAEQGLAERAAG